MKLLIELCLMFNGKNFDGDILYWLCSRQSSRCPSGEHSVLGPCRVSKRVGLFNDKWPKCLMKKPLPKHIFLIHIMLIKSLICNFY